MEINEFMPRVTTGLEVLLEDPPDFLRNRRLGLLCNPASIDSRFHHARHLIDQKLPGQLKALYSPQHGFFSEKQDNMIESDDRIDDSLNIPIFSLYGNTRIPTPDMLDPIDVLLVDIQDVGTRVYTFIYTMSYCMETCRDLGKKVCVLDRPNPIGGIRKQGNVLAGEYTSFVGRYPIPMRHGLTIGELARLFNEAFGIGCELEVIPMRGWRRDMLFPDTGLPWAAPSPNMPTPATALVYPGQVIWEGTNVSEGRGTTQPFEIFGAPFIDANRIKALMGEIEGAVLRPLAFEPTFHKWTGELCRGFQIHVTDADRFDSYRTALHLLWLFACEYGDRFQWKAPPYEYEFERLPIDLLLGDRRIREQIENRAPMDDIVASWRPRLEEYIRHSRAYHLYL